MVISFANQKGGTGKSTTVIALAGLLSKLGQSVLVVDIDPQASTTNSLMKFNEEKENDLLLDQIVYRPLIDGNDLDLRIIPESNITLAPASSLLSNAEIELALMSDAIENSRFHRLKRWLDTVKDRYHYVLIDCPGNLGLLTINGLVASDKVIVVSSVGKFERNSTRYFVKEISTRLIQYNPSLNILGILLTMTDVYKVTDKTRQKLRESQELSGLVFRTEIPKNNALKNAEDEDMSIWKYDPLSTGGKAYMKLLDEIKERL